MRRHLPRVAASSWRPPTTWTPPPPSTEKKRAGWKDAWVAGDALPSTGLKELQTRSKDGFSISVSTTVS
uniref:Uncharacterized protein n=1 Tax=Oryza nivara TaxID=4536 RepID=A0A0E0HR45_ORYNI